MKRRVSTAACAGKPAVPDEQQQRDYQSTEESKTTDATEITPIENAKGEPIPKATGPVATVDGKEVPATDFNLEIERIVASGMPPGVLNQFKDQIVDKLIDRTLIDNAIGNASIKVPAADVDAKMEEVRAEFAKASAAMGEKTTLEDVTKKLGITKDELRESIEQSIAIEKILVTRGMEEPDEAKAKSLTPADLAERLAFGREIPDWFSFPEVIRELRRSSPPRSRQGFTVFFSGLPSSGKSTLANVLLVKLLEVGGRPVTLLDGDIVRQNLSSELGFSREHRNLNIRRIGFVDSEITKNGGIAICAPIAPYDAVRKDVRATIEPGGGFLLVHVATPLEVCETRDRKGLYAKARAGIVKEFTGISDPYEEPADAGMVVDTTERSPEECVQSILLHLEKESYIGRPGGGGES